MAGLALFDFDGTITKTDTLFAIIRFVKGEKAFRRGMRKLLPHLVKFKLGYLSAQAVKEKVLTHFFKGMSMEDFRSQCGEFGYMELPLHIRKGARETIQQYVNEGTRVIVVTASAEEWVQPFCTGMRIELLGSRMEVDAAGCITGKLLGLNCNGEEKVCRIKAHVALSDYDPIHAYGDSTGDKPMLALAGEHAHFKPFR